MLHGQCRVGVLVDVLIDCALDALHVLICLLASVMALHFALLDDQLIRSMVTPLAKSRRMIWNVDDPAKHSIKHTDHVWVLNSGVSDELFAVDQVDLALQLHLNGEVPERLSGALLVLLSEPTIRVLGGQNAIAMFGGRTPIELSHASCPRMPGLSWRPLFVSVAALTVTRDGSSAALRQISCSILTQRTSDTPFF